MEGIAAPQKRAREGRGADPSENRSSSPRTPPVEPRDEGAEMTAWLQRNAYGLVSAGFLSSLGAALCWYPSPASFPDLGPRFEPREPDLDRSVSAEPPRNRPS